MSILSNYVEITKNEFEKGLREIQTSLSVDMIGSIIPIREDGTWEYIYEFMTSTKDIKLRIYSSVDLKSNRSRALGTDAIRCVAIYEKQEIFRGTRHTKRMTKWKEHLHTKMVEMLAQIYEVPSCPKCRRLMIQRKSKHGLFWGCSGFPTCKQVQRIKAK